MVCKHIIIKNRINIILMKIIQTKLGKGKSISQIAIIAEKRCYSNTFFVVCKHIIIKNRINIILMKIIQTKLGKGKSISQIAEALEVTEEEIANLMSKER